MLPTLLRACRMELADPAGLYPRRLARVEEGGRRALEARLHLEGSEERLDRASGDGESALGDRGHMRRRSSGSSSPVGR